MFTEEYWANSQLSIARYYGQVRFNGFEYIIVDKRGHDIFQCSAEAEKAGREKAIEPGEPCDLVLRSWVPVYRALGRDKFMKYIQELPNYGTLSDLLAKAKAMVAKMKADKHKSTNLKNKQS